MKLNLVMADDPLAELRSLAATLEQAFERFPGLRPQVYQLLFTSSDALQDGLIELRLTPAAGTGRMAVSLGFSDRLREIVAAAAAGDVERLRINE